MAALLLLLLAGPAASALQLQASFTGGEPYRGKLWLKQKGLHIETVESWSSLPEEAFEASQDGATIGLAISAAPCTELLESLGGGQIYIDNNGSTEGVTLFGNRPKAVVIVERRQQQCDTEVPALCEEELTVLACAELVADTFELTTEILIILIAAGAIFVVMVICIPIIYCCLKNRGRRGEEKRRAGAGDGDSVDDPFLMNRRHTQSELSIPFMDASLPPTPKGGRSGFRLDDLLGNNNKSSTGSLSGRLG